MKKKLAVILVILVLLAGGAWVWHHKKSAKPAPAIGSSYTPSAQNPPTATKSVSIQNYSYTPADITVKLGSTVTWTNMDQVAYTVTEDDNNSSGPNSGPIPPQQIFQFTFKKAGLFHYHNSLDPNMTGTVTVSAQ